MTLAEFKAWFEGFCEGIGGAPTEQHLATIREKIATVHPETAALPNSPWELTGTKPEPSPYVVPSVWIPDLPRIDTAPAIPFPGTVWCGGTEPTNQQIVMTN